MKNIDDYKKIVDEDFSILSEDKIENAIDNVAYNSAKWAKFLYDETLFLKEIEQTHFFLIKELQEYYDGSATIPFQKKLLKNQVEKYIRADKKYMESNMKVKKQELLVAYLQNLYDHFKFQRSRVLHDKIDLMKYFSGRGI